MRAAEVLVFGNWALLGGLAASCPMPLLIHGGGGGGGGGEGADPPLLLLILLSVFFTIRFWKKWNEARGLNKSDG